jgi:hypothetical protein
MFWKWKTPGGAVPDFLYTLASLQVRLGGYVGLWVRAKPQKSQLSFSFSLIYFS